MKEKSLPSVHDSAFNSLVIRFVTCNPLGIAWKRLLVSQILKNSCNYMLVPQVKEVFKE